MESTSLPPPQASPGQDLFTRVQCFSQLPEYESYRKGFVSLPAPPASGWDLAWPFPTPPALGFDRALPGYVGPFLQSLTPLGCAGARRSAPWPPPRRCASEDAGEAGEQATWQQPCLAYEDIPEQGADPVAAAQILASRLVGDPRRSTGLCATQPPPEENHDALHQERLTVYEVLRRDSGLRYNVDGRRFFRTLAGSGEMCEVLSLARANQILRQGQAGLPSWLRLLPHEQHLFTPPPPAPPKPARRAAPVVPPTAPTPTSTSTPSPAPAPAKQPAPSPIPALSPAPAPPVAPAVSPAPPPAALAEPVTQVAQEPQPAPAPQPVTPPPIPTVPFVLKIHRYWDLAAGAYCAVSEVLLEGEGCDEVPLVNSEKLPAFGVNLSLPLGASVKVTVTWANGLTRSWEEKLSRHSGIETEVFSPDG